MSMFVSLSRSTPRCVQRRILSRYISVAAAATSSTTSDAVHHDGMTGITRQLARVLSTPDRHADPQEEGRLRNQRRFALARAITLVESSAPAQRRQGDLLLTNLLASAEKNIESSSFRVGIAGPPGAGKSTFIETFGLRVLNKDGSEEESLDTARTRADCFSPSKLAVLCIDPSSSVTGGSILGDKTRMTELSRHERVRGGEHY